MDAIRVLIIGNESWISTIEDTILSHLNEKYLIEKITDENEAIERLTHNSYDILLLKSKFGACNPIKLTSMAYAMTRPSIILCSNIFSNFYYNLWKKFSKFTNIFKTSKKLIFITSEKSPSIIDKIIYLSKNHLQYFNIIAKEIDDNVKL